jgi:hypothetical protein
VSADSARVKSGLEIAVIVKGLVDGRRLELPTSALRTVAVASGNVLSCKHLLVLDSAMRQIT